MPNSINSDSDADMQVWHNEEQLLDYTQKPAIEPRFMQIHNQREME